MAAPPRPKPRAAFPEARVRAQRRRNFLHGVLVAALLASAAVAAMSAGITGLVVSLLALVLPSLGLLAWQRARTPSGGARIEVGEEGLFAEGKLLVPRADMRRAVVVGEADSAVVSIQRSQGYFVALDVPDEAEGRRLVSALGLSAEQRTAEFPVDSPLATHVPASAVTGALAALIGASLVGLAMGYPLVSLSLVAWYGFVLAWLRPRSVAVGTDGILISWLGMETLLPFSRLSSVTRERGGLHIRTAEEKTIRIRARQITRQRRSAQPEMASEDVYMETLESRIQEAREASGGAEVTVLERKGRPLGEWVLHLRSLTAREASGFRAAPVVPEALWKTVENGNVWPAARAAAAVALGPSLDEGGRERLRVASRVVVAPKLRVALEAAAAGDEAAVASALAELEAAQVTASARGARRGDPRG